MKKYNKTFYYMALANFTFFLGNSFFFLFPVFLKSLGASESYIGIMSNIDKIFVIFTSASIATFLIVRNKILFLRAGYFIVLVAFISYLLINRISWMIPVIRIINGIGFSIGMIMGSTIIFDIVPPENAAEAIGIYGVAAAITNAISPFIGETLLSVGFTFRSVFIIPVVMICITLAVTFMIPKPELFKGNENRSPKGFLYLFKKSGFLLMTVITITFGGVFGIIITYLPNYVLTTTKLKFSYFFITYIAVLILIRFRVIGLLKQLRTNNLIRIMFFLAFVMYIILNFLDTYILLIIAGLIYGTVHGVLYPVLNTIMVDLVASDERNKANAIFTGCFIGGVMLFSFTLGFVIDITGTYKAAFNACAVILLAQIAMISIYNFKNRKSGDIKAI